MTISFSVLIILLLLCPTQPLRPTAPVIDWPPAHWTAIVTPLQAPLFDTGFTDIVTADKLGAAAVLEAHRAFHSLTCFEE